MICILIGISPPSSDIWDELNQKVKTIGKSHAVQWIGQDLVHDDGKMTRIVTAVSDAPVDWVVEATAEACGDQYTCELWASAPAILPLKPAGGYDNLISYNLNSNSTLEEWAPETLREWGLFVQKSIISSNEVHELRGYVDEEIVKTEGMIRMHRPEINIGEDTFLFREIASRGNHRFDLLLQSDSAREFVENTILKRISPVLEKMLGDSDEYNFDMSVVYSRGGAPIQGWHCDGDHQKGGKDAGWDIHGWKTQMTELYGLCLFIPLIDLTDETGFTQFWPASHRNRDLMGFGPVAEISEATWDGKCKAGDAIWYDYRLFHRGMANTSNSLRPVLQIFVKKKWYVEKANYGKIGIAETATECTSDTTLESNDSS